MTPTDRRRAVLRPFAACALAGLLAACTPASDLLRRPDATPATAPAATHGPGTGKRALPPALDAAERLEQRASDELARGDTFAAARTRAELDRTLEGGARDANRQTLRALLAELDLATLRADAERLGGDDPLRPWLEQALRERGEPLPRNLPQPSRQIDTLAADQDLRAEGYRAPRQVALLLPQSSTVAAVAQSIRDGFMTAWFADPPAQRPQLRIYDSGRNSQDAIAAYRQAVADGADRVVGPLLREAVGALFHESLTAPLLALNHPDTGEVPPAGSAEYGLLPEAEGAQVAERMLQRGIHQAAIMRADADWANRAASAFRAQFEAAGGAIAAQVQLADKDINYAAPIREATASLAQDGTAAVFISLRPQQARLLVAQLRAARVAVPVLATSHIYAGDANATLDRDLNGVEFCDAPWLFGPIAGRPDRSAVTAQIDSANGAGGRLFAFGMDAYALLPYIDWLVAHPDAYLNGATGQLTADHFGRVHRLVGWARFDNGLAVPVTGALEATPVPAQ
ncbi:MAG: penicillin-binding protein activator [Dokdonella sp.]|uniref:penicillin-binding protein activator n=1 Tax=Dokdonella sp. TaxID=2291710 RepID=UPI0025C454B3|nr:penicillin-binding protein activator [Dokdonella sp.]MBX3701746.1 penicillin-binding protein activator [Dokdonella sp.]